MGPVLALRRVRVARPAVASQVEREEAGPRRLAREGAEVRAHPDLVLGDGEVAPLLYMSSGFFLPPSGSTGLRSSAYSSMASRTVWVSSVLTSPVATGMPLTNRTKSRDLLPAVW